MKEEKKKEKKNNEQIYFNHKPSSIHHHTNKIAESYTFFRAVSSQQVSGVLQQIKYNKFVKILYRNRIQCIQKHSTQHRSENAVLFVLLLVYYQIVCLGFGFQTDSLGGILCTYFIYVYSGFGCCCVYVSFLSIIN